MARVPCKKCKGPVGCFDCDPRALKLQAENRRLKRELAAQASAPTGDEAQEELKKLREKFSKLQQAAVHLHSQVGYAYTEVLENRAASKMQYVFDLGSRLKAFLEENFSL